MKGNGKQSDSGKKEERFRKSRIISMLVIIVLKRRRICLDNCASSLYSRLL